MCWGRNPASIVGRKGMPWAPSPQRGENGRAEKIAERSAKKTERGGDTAERRRLPERFGPMSRGGPHRCCGTTTVQELDEDLFAALISSFRWGDEPNWPSISDQEAMCSIPATRNSGGSPTTRGVGKRNGDISCWWGKSVWEMRKLQNLVYSSNFAVSIVWIVSFSTNFFL